MKYFVFLALFAATATYATPIRVSRELEADEKSSGLGSSGFHHEIEHEHAKSHQSVKFEHFHPVPVYVKKEHSHLLKHPLEKGKSEHGIKLLHPKTEHHHGYGLVLEEHRHDIEDHHGGFGGGDDFGGYSKHDEIPIVEHAPEVHENEGEWNAGSEQVAAYASHGLQDDGHQQYQQYQYQPIELEGYHQH